MYVRAVVGQMLLLLLLPLFHVILVILTSGEELVSAPESAWGVR